MYIDLFLLNQSVFSIRDGKLFYPKGYSRNKKYGRAHLFYNDAYNNFIRNLTASCGELLFTSSTVLAICLILIL